MADPVDVAVVILTWNEEKNIAQALSSVCGWARQVFVFDSFSTDRTVDLARTFAGVEVMQHRFEDYGKQRNAALERLPIDARWIFFLDADEHPSEALKRELAARLDPDPPENGFYVRWRLLWMGVWIRRGYYPAWALRVVRRGAGRCEDRAVNEHMVVTPPLGYLENDILHEDHNGLDRWIQKHLRYADGEAKASFDRASSGALDASPFGTQAERKRWVRTRVWDRLPPFVRPVLYFGYRYVARGGFLDGREALAFHLLQALWFQTIVDIKYIDLARAAAAAADARGDRGDAKDEARAGERVRGPSRGGAGS